MSYNDYRIAKGLMMKRIFLLSVFTIMSLLSSPLYGENLPGQQDGADQSEMTPPPPEPTAGAGDFMPGMTGRPPAPLSYSFLWLGKQSVQGQTANFESYRYVVETSIPVMQNDPGGLMFSAGMTADRINTAAVFPDSQMRFPDMLWDIRFGLHYMHRLKNGWSLMGGVNARSASDRPFSASQDINAGVMLLLSIPKRKNDALNLGLMYMPLSDMTIPIPTLAYVWQPSPILRMNIGLPFQVTYKPYDSLAFDFSYMLLRNIQSRLTYRLNHRNSVYAAYVWANQAWSLHERKDDEERLNLYDQRVAVGIQSELFRRLELDASIGYAFDRFYFTGKDYSDRNHDRIDIDNGLFFSIKLLLKHDLLQSRQQKTHRKDCN